MRSQMLWYKMRRIIISVCSLTKIFRSALRRIHLNVYALS